MAGFRSFVLGLYGPRRVLSAVERASCGSVLHKLRAVPVTVALPDGSVVSRSTEPVRYGLHLRSHRAVLGFVTGNSVVLGDCYRDGEIDIDGELVELLTAVNRSVDYRAPFAGFRIRRRGSISRFRAARNVRHHYARDRDFYAAWLDTKMIYTCAYFQQPSTSLEDAQVAKMERICRKLRLQAGDRVVEAGSGWGALAIYMASRYRVRVRAFNASVEQVEWSRDAARRAGLADRVEFVASDYRDIDGTADAFVSVGMLEHVGLRGYRDFGTIVSRVLGESGRALLHTIGRTSPLPTDGWIERRIFPGGYAPSLAEVSRVFEPNDLTVVHVENLRPHYARTLSEWRTRFDLAAAEGRLGDDLRIIRAWRLYLAASEAAFLTGWAQLFQILVVPRTNTEFEAPGLDGERPGYLPQLFPGD